MSYKDKVRLQNVSKLYGLDIDKSRRVNMLRLLANTFFVNLKPFSSEIYALQNVSFSIEKNESIALIGMPGSGRKTLARLISGSTNPTYGRVSRGLKVVNAIAKLATFRPLMTLPTLIDTTLAFLGGSSSQNKSIRERIMSEITMKDHGKIKLMDVDRKIVDRAIQLCLLYIESDFLIIDHRFFNLYRDFIEEHKQKNIIFLASHPSEVPLWINRGIVLHRGIKVFDGDIKSCSGVYNTSRAMCLSEQPSAPPPENFEWAIKDFHKRYIKNELQVLIKNHRTLKILPNIKSYFTSTDSFEGRYGVGDVRIASLRIHDRQGRRVESTATGEVVSLEIDYIGIYDDQLKNVSIFVNIFDDGGNKLGFLSTDAAGSRFATAPASGTISLTIPKLPLVPGSYPLTVSIFVNGELQDQVAKGFALRVNAGDYFGTKILPSPGSGYFCLDFATKHKLKGKVQIIQELEERKIKLDEKFKSQTKDH